MEEDYGAIEKSYSGKFKAEIDSIGKDGAKLSALVEKLASD